MARDREKSIQRDMQSCVHFNGALNACCKAGVNYDAMRQGKPFPCYLSEARPGTIEQQKANAEAMCPKFELTSREVAEREFDELEARLKEFDEHLAKGISVCCKAPIDKSRVITAGRHKGHGPRYCSQCGKCLFMV